MQLPPSSGGIKVGGDAINFYKTRKWKRKREVILRRDNYQCRQCKRYGRITPANTVHHIHPIEVRPELALVSDNLISLCEGCHGRMHDRTTNKLTDLGLQWVARSEA